MQIITDPELSHVLEQTYKDNFVYHWLKRPCLQYCTDKERLSPINVFYTCFQILDTIVPYLGTEDSRLKNHIAELPYEASDLIRPENYAGVQERYDADLIFLLDTWNELLHMPEDDDLFRHTHCIEKRIEEVLEQHNAEEQVTLRKQYKDIHNALTQKSVIFKDSQKIMRTEDWCEMKTPHLIDYIAGYIVSGEHISEKIAAMVPKNDALQDTAAEERTVVYAPARETIAEAPAVQEAPASKEEAEEKEKKGQVNLKVAVALVVKLLEAAGIDSGTAPKGYYNNTAELIHALTGYSTDKIKKDLPNSERNLTNYHNEAIAYINELLQNLGSEIRLASFPPKK